MIKELKKIKCGKIIENVDLSKYTTYHIHAKARMMVIPENEKQLFRLLNYIKKNNISYKVIGGGSNLIFEQDYDGILIQLSEFCTLEIADTEITVGAGYSTLKLALKISRMGYTGMEFATGIPGTIGGAIVNNSGAYGSDMGYITESILVITPTLELKRMYNKEIDFHYRTSFLKKNPGYICLQAHLIIKPGNCEKIMEIIEDRKSRRLMDQPLEYPSAGSVFRNPPNLYAGKLIEDLGLKGYQIGNAQISEKHANFIVAKGPVFGKDIVKLIHMIQEKVKKQYQVDLILEQEIVK